MNLVHVPGQSSGWSVFQHGQFTLLVLNRRTYDHVQYRAQRKAPVPQAAVPRLPHACRYPGSYKLCPQGGVTEGPQDSQR
jgi:hypothetical protein